MVVVLRLVFVYHSLGYFEGYTSAQESQWGYDVFPEQIGAVHTSVYSSTPDLFLSTLDDQAAIMLARECTKRYRDEGIISLSVNPGRCIEMSAIHRRC